MRIESSSAGLGRTWVAGTAIIVDDVSTGSASERGLNETGTALQSGAADWIRPLVPTRGTVTAEVGTASLTLGAPLNSLDKRFRNPDFDEGPEETDLALLTSPGA